VTPAVRERVEVAATLLGAIAARDVPLGPLTTYRVGGGAALFVRARTLDDLHAVSQACRRAELPVLVVGRGSNLLVADDGFHGVALQITELQGSGAAGWPLGADVVVDGDLVAAGGAVALPVLARRTVAASLTGFEWAVGVPGSVGGGVRMNAGGHGSDIAASLVEVLVFDLRRDDLGVRAAEQLGLRFRGSDLADHQVVLSARLRLAVGDRDRSQAELDEIVRWRREHQPGGQNAGSVFVNPVPGEVAAGELVDRVGLRGYRLGTAPVSDKHANFIQADDGGRAADVRALMHLVRDRVAAETGYRLRSEVRLVGFDADLDAEPDADLDGATW
jgi:UDP-N-acetylmuramate dehydrogenase